MIIVDLSKMSALVERIGLKQMMSELIAQLFQGYLAFDQFDKSPRQACYVDRGVIELMPICNEQYHAVKWINCHPENVASGKLSIVGLGVWSEVTYGFPLMVTEMTLLTAIRTACATGLFLKHAVTGLEVNSVGLIGAGAQSEFHATMIAEIFPKAKIWIYDIDPSATEKFLNNMDKVGINCHRAMSAKHICEIAPVVITLTAHRSINRVIENDWLGDHHVLAAIGGDAPGKTELDPEIIARSDVVVQYLPQTEKEGEIQHGQALSLHHLHEVISRPLVVGSRPIVFDSVGFAIEDFISMQYVWSQLKDSNEEALIIPHLADPKNLFSLLTNGGC